MKSDVSSRKDIYLIVSQFYKKLLSDHEMIPFFQEIIHNNSLKHHLEIITNFWEDILFDSKKYHNNTIKKHIEKHAFVQFKKQHFERWISYFFETIEDQFSR